MKNFLRLLPTLGLVALLVACSSSVSKDALTVADADHEFTLQELWPAITTYADKYSFNPQVLAAIICQESSFQNLIVHDDGTGHGLLGLDDNGLLPDFEAWVCAHKPGHATYHVGRGARALSMRPDWQIEFAAMTLAQYSRDYGGNYAAARAWHSGVDDLDSADAREYEALIRKHVAALF